MQEIKGLLELPTQNFVPGILDNSIYSNSRDTMSNKSPFESACNPLINGHNSLLGPLPIHNRSSLELPPYQGNSLRDVFNPYVGSRLQNDQYPQPCNSGNGLLPDSLIDTFSSLGMHSEYGNTYGLSIEFLRSKGITGPLVNTIFFANVSLG